MTNPFLTKVQLTTYNSAKAPTSATVTFYQPGAWVAAATTLEPHSYDITVPVSDTAPLTVGDRLTVGADGPILPLAAITGPTEIMFDNPGDTAIALTAGMRLLRVAAAPPRLYSGSGGPLISGNAITTDPFTGRGVVFVEADRFDYIVAVAGQPKRITADASGGRFHSEIDWNDVRDFASIQAAIDALPAAGGTVYIPAGEYQLAAGLVITKDSVTLKGDGSATYLRRRLFDQHDLITVMAGRCTVSDLKLDGHAGGGGEKRALDRPLPETGRRLR